MEIGSIVSEITLWYKNKNRLVFYNIHIYVYIIYEENTVFVSGDICVSQEIDIN